MGRAAGASTDTSAQQHSDGAHAPDTGGASRTPFRTHHLYGERARQITSPLVACVKAAQNLHYVAQAVVVAVVVAGVRALVSVTHPSSFRHVEINLD